MQSVHKATLIGLLSIFSWSTASSLVSSVKRLPAFEIQMFVFSVSFLIAAIAYRSLLLEALKQTPVIMLLVGVLGLYGQNTFFVLSLQHAPPEQADLINFTWPILVIFGSAFLPNEKLKIQHVLGALICFSGIFLLLGLDTQFDFKNKTHNLGYLFAFGNACCWATYTLFARKYKQVPSKIIGIYCGCVAILGFINHISFEKFVMPSNQEFLFLSLIGLTCNGLAYFFWDYGVKRGRYRLLCLLSYFIPIGSISSLVIFGFTHFRAHLIIAALFVSLGALIGAEMFSGVPAYFKKSK